MRKLNCVTQHCSNLSFQFVYKWCDDHPRCKRIKLQGFLIKPLQRVTKYSLLLRAVQSKTVNENDKQMLDKMVRTIFLNFENRGRALAFTNKYSLLTWACIWSVYCLSKSTVSHLDNPHSLIRLLSVRLIQPLELSQDELDS